MIPVIVLAGGFGTRLQAVVPDRPKPLADVAGQPFLWWLLRYLARQGVADAYLSVGYRREMISDYFGAALDGLSLHYVIEENPLGTGGAIRLALEHCTSDEVLVVNGDTLATLDLASLLDFARSSKADITIAAADVPDTARYGGIQISDPERRVLAFHEKGRVGPGLINAGVYVLRRAAIMAAAPAGAFSFEQDILQKRLQTLGIYAFPCVGDFIDIGVPDDYARAQHDVPAFLARVG